MKLRLITTLLIASATVVSAQSPNAAEGAPESIRDADSYAIYAMLLPQAWSHSNPSSEMMLLQHETGTPKPLPLCSYPKEPLDAEWAVVERSYQAENARDRLLLKDMLKLDIPYRLIPRAEIAADDARLHQKYPGTWQRLPESKEIAYVSTVGFNVNKSKAIVHIGLRSQGWVVRLEKRDGRWVKTPYGCSWIA